MRIRRRFSSGGWLDRAWQGVRAGARAARAALTPDASRFAWLRPGNRFAAVAVGVFLTTLVGGYVLAATVFFPAPIFAASRSVPRVIGLDGNAAREALLALGLAGVETERVTHPTVANGAVVWQDPPPDMTVPEGTEIRLTMSAGPQRIPVPDVGGYDADNARLLLESAGLVVGRIESAQAPTPANVAVNTRPPAGTALLPGADVTLVVSVGAATIRVPTLVGLTLDSARVALEAAGLALGPNYARRSNLVEAGQIFFQEPAAGTLSAPGTQINVIVASGND